jgi:hypothetical protein
VRTTRACQSHLSIRWRSNATCPKAFSGKCPPPRRRSSAAPLHWPRAAP